MRRVHAADPRDGVQQFVPAGAALGETGDVFQKEARQEVGTVAGQLGSTVKIE